MDEIEINGRLNMLEKQRNDALEESVIKSGQLAVAYKAIKELQEENERLRSEESTVNGTDQ